tara:strand:+ start:1204 stop:1734 length:531 start_codon:yes stop_codon:yes gene_type:complete
MSDAPVDEVSNWFRTNAHGKHEENYSNLSLDKGHLAVTIERIDGEITCASTIYRRDYYPPRCVRILNKWLTTVKIGGTKKNILSDRAITIVNQQMYIAEMLGYTSFFISFHSYIPEFCNEITKKLSVNTEWKWSNGDFVQVAPGVNKKNYQHVIYTGQGIEKFINNKITEQAWREI